jgi:hypothetical protein
LPEVRNREEVSLPELGVEQRCLHAVILGCFADFYGINNAYQSPLHALAQTLAFSSV